MSSRINITSGAKWESIVGYSRAVKVGNIIELAGTTAAQGGEVLHPGDVAKQTEHILNLFKKVLEENGSSLSDVVRTRVYVTNIKDWQEVGKVHGQFFGEVMPASTMLEVSALVDPEMLVEIEATAIISNA